MNDVIPPESSFWGELQLKARRLFESFGFSEIITPVVERTDLFTQSVGQTTDIIEKQMYTFEDKKGERLSLRPEGTAPVVRAYLEHQLYHPDPYKKLYYWGPMYRYERTQKGRYRQFYQFGVEVFGAPSPRIDAETIYMVTQYYKEVGVKSFEVQINSMGCQTCRPPYREMLLSYLRPLSSELCADCQRRLEKNPLRTLDCKEERCRVSTKKAPKIVDHLCQSCKDHFQGLKEALHQLNVENVMNPNIVRGLDYYVRTAFEIVSSDLGSQDALGGGGRYDGLVKALGGADIPAFGFAGGIERLVMVLSRDLSSSIDLYVAALGPKAEAFSFALTNKLRMQGIRTEIDYNDFPLKQQMKKGDRFNARFVLIIGDQEMEAGEAILRNMSTKEQLKIPFGELRQAIPEKVKRSS